jgi:hypothetical protein
MKTATMILTVAGVATAIVGGLWAVGEVELSKFKVRPIKPGKVTFVAINTDLGFDVRVANSVAQLVQVDKRSDGFQSNSQEGGEDARRIPIRELLESLQGNEVSLVRLVAILNKIDLDDLQPGVTAWNAEDIRLALDGDPTLAKKLVEDLNVQLDGTPIEQIRLKSILNGIRVFLPVPVKVNIEGQTKTLIARLPITYQPRFAKDIASIIEKRFNPPQEFIVGNYRSEADKLLANPGSKEDVRANLESLIREEKIFSYSKRPEQVLQGAQVLINETMVKGATQSVRKNSKGEDLFTVRVAVTDEGRKRLWKYSRNQKGSRLLVVVNGVAIAAPAITTELAGYTVDLTDLREKRLVEDAIKTIESLKQP